MKVQRNHLRRTLSFGLWFGAVAACGGGTSRGDNTLGEAGEHRAACASCHGLTNGVDPSPGSLSSHTDDIISAITTGKYQSGRALRGADHAMNLTDAEKLGIVPYLRALSPRS